MVKVAVVTIIETDDPRIIRTPEGVDDLKRAVGAIIESLPTSVAHVIAIMPAHQGEAMVRAHMEVMTQWAMFDVDPARRVH